MTVYTEYDRARDNSLLGSLRRDAIRADHARGRRGALQPMDTTAAAGNELRPTTFAEVVGQGKAKAMLARMVATAKARGVPLDHVLLVGPAGTGKTTLAHVIATELQSQVYQLEAPVDADTLAQLAEVMGDGDILFLDEIHQQALGDRRGRSSSTQPEVLFSIMEDFTMPTSEGVIPFPRITIMGATTDEGRLPDPFIDRFPIRPRLERYSVADMTEIAFFAARKKGLQPTRVAARTFAEASRGVPRVVINFVKNAAMFTEGAVTPELATEVVVGLNGYTLDGLTPDQQAMLKFLLRRCRRTTGAGEVRYQASVSSIATAIGKSRDTQAVQLRIEPHLIEIGYLQVLHGGRALTDAGVARAQQLPED